MAEARCTRDRHSAHPSRELNALRGQSRNRDRRHCRCRVGAGAARTPRRPPARRVNEETPSTVTEQDFVDKKRRGGVRTKKSRAVALAFVEETVFHRQTKRLEICRPRGWIVIQHTALNDFRDAEMGAIFRCGHCKSLYDPLNLFGASVTFTAVASLVFITLHNIGVGIRQEYGRCWRPHSAPTSLLPRQRPQSLSLDPREQDAREIRCIGPAPTHENNPSSSIWKARSIQSAAGMDRP